MSPKPRKPRSRGKQKAFGESQPPDAAAELLQAGQPEAAEAHPPKTPPRLPIVGIGASAGGLEALEQFFEHLPAKPGMAFVVILHLSPEHESHLARLVQRHTAMAVMAVTEPVMLEPDHVYIISPKQNLSVADGLLHIADLERPAGLRTTIDQFLRSLAQAHGSDAIGIILSGTGADGTLGLKAIKEQGGLAMVQAPEEAGHDGMPRNAIATGLVDFVLPVSQLAAKLVAYKESTVSLFLPAQEDALCNDEEDALRKIFTQLLTKTGHDITCYKRSTVLRRLARRLRVNQLPDFSAYLPLLRRSPEEAQALLSDLLICVTNFFRDPEAFAALETTVIPALFEGKEATDQVRVWVTGCATGEEAYSVAMLLLEHAARLERAPEIKVFATDISEAAIATARNGFYPASIEADVLPQRLKRFFSKESQGYRVKNELRGVVLFAVHDLLKAPPFSKLDLVTCRNLLIYLKRDVQQQVFELFYYALHPYGYLFLGTSESVNQDIDLFAPVSKEYRLYRRGVVARNVPILPPVPIVGAAYEKAPSAEEAPDKKSFSLGDVHQKLLEQYAPPSLIVKETHDVVHMSERAGRYLQFAGGAPTFNLLKVIHPGLLFELRAILYQVFEKGKAMESKWVPVKIDGTARHVRLIVRPAGAPVLRQGFALVIFDEREEPDEADAEHQAEAPQAALTSDHAEMNQVIVQLEEELRTAREHLQVTIEQYDTSTEELKSSNEELLSINEELKSAGEELETSKEELESTNEELVTVNQELKTKIEELALLNSDLQNLMASTEIGTLFLDRELRLRRFTPRITDLFNITSTDMGRPLAHFTHKLLGSSNLLGDAGQVLNNLMPIEWEVHSEEDQWYLVRLLPYFSTAHKIDGVVVTFVDITAHRRAEQEREQLIAALEAKNTELERFSYTVSHDLKSPLITIQGFLRILEEDIAAQKAQSVQEDIRYIRDAAVKMQRLLDELLALSRSGLLINQPETISLTDLARKAVEQVAGQIEARSVVVEIDAAMPEVSGDRGRLLQVLQNLIDNAVKYMGDQAKPRIEIGARQEGDEVLVYVQDNGIGITPKYHDRIFDLFERLDAKSEGSGIGLAMAKRIVEKHDGRIWVESAGLGHGSTFYCTIPGLEQAPPQCGSQSSVRTHFTSGT